MDVQLKRAWYDLTKFKQTNKKKNNENTLIKKNSWDK